MLALGQARFGAGRRDRSVNDLGMSLRGNHALLHKHRPAHRAVLALRKAGCRAGRRHRRVNDLGMLLHRAHSRPRAGLLAAARSVAHALRRLGAIRSAGCVLVVRVDFELMAQRLHGLLLHNHLLADCAVLALGQAGCRAGRGHRIVHCGLAVAAGKLACAADARGRIVVVGAGGFAGFANAVGPVVGAHQITEYANAVDPFVPAHFATVAALAFVPPVRFRVIINVRATAAPRQIMNITAYRYPYLFIRSTAVGAGVFTVRTYAREFVPSVLRLRDLQLAAAPHALVRGRSRRPLQRAAGIMIIIISVSIVTDRAYGTQARRTIDIMAFRACLY